MHSSIPALSIHRDCTAECKSQRKRVMRKDPPHHSQAAAPHTTREAGRGRMRPIRLSSADTPLTTRRRLPPTQPATQGAACAASHRRPRARTRCRCRAAAAAASSSRGPPQLMLHPLPPPQRRGPPWAGAAALQLAPSADRRTATRRCSADAAARAAPVAQPLAGSGADAASHAGAATRGL